MNNFTTNSTIIYNISSLSNSCELNQIKMLNSLNKISIGVFVFILIVFLALFSYYWVLPMFKKYKWYDEVSRGLLGLAFMSSIWALLFALPVSFNFSESFWNYAEVFLILMIGLILLLVYLRMRKKQNGKKNNEM